MERRSKGASAVFAKAVRSRAEPELSGLCSDEEAGRTLLHKAVSSPFPRPLPRGEVMRMGNERWNKILRFALCVVIAIMVMLVMAPKAC